MTTYPHIVRAPYLTLPIISISLMIIPLVLTNIAYAQVEGTFQTEQDPTTGRKRGNTDVFSTEEVNQSIQK